LGVFCCAVTFYRTTGALRGLAMPVG
jgi:hypothetical protein